MLEIHSREAAKVLAGKKMRNDEALGRQHVISISSPATAAWSQDDTIASPVRLPVGTRILGAVIYHSAMGSGVKMNIGLRQTDANQSVISSDGIAKAINVASAGQTAARNGELVTVGTHTLYRTPVESEIYAQLTSANPTDNAQFRIDITVVLPG